MAITFDGPNTLITLSSGDTTVEVSEIYSRWKDWVLLSDNAKYLPAFREVGGDPLGGGVFSAVNVFVRNDIGWRIKPPEEHIDITLVGNIYPEDAGSPWRIQTTGQYTASISVATSANALVLDGNPWDAVIEQGLTAAQAMRLIAAATAGKISGAGGSTVTIRNAVDDSANRIVATVDDDGNRTAITYDLD